MAEALEDGEFDAVDIMLPHHLHEDVALQCFAAGKHVLLEKPMAPTPVACDRILAAAAQAGTVFMVAEQSQYWPDALKVQQMIQEGIIGDIITARAFFGGAAGNGRDEKPWRHELGTGRGWHRHRRWGPLDPAVAHVAW